jgi:PTH1 family peptidyl-tRNA hydrolase
MFSAALAVMFCSARGQDSMPAQQKQAPRLLVGLGNPEPEYQGTRHNLGARLARRLAQMSGSSFTYQARFQSLVLKQGEFYIALPQAYMNCSGQAVVALANFYRFVPSQVIVFQDELDLPVGRVRLKYGGGAGGHNGIKDIVQKLATPDFWRLRLGIGRPVRQATADYVLQLPSRAEEPLVEAALDQVICNMHLLLSGDYAELMQRLHTEAGL